jgi:hypothetical protein
MLSHPVRFIGLFVVFIAFSLGSTASASVTLVGTSTNTNHSATSIAINKPTTNIGDVMIAHLSYSGCCSVSGTPPTGWTTISEENNSGGVTNLLAYKIVTASEPSSYTWSFSASVNSAGGIADYSGVSPNWPVDAYAAADGSGTTMTAPAITATIASEELLGFFAGLGNNSWTVPTGMTQVWQLDSGSSSTDADAWLADQSLSSSGSTGTRTSTQSVTGAWDAGLAALYTAPAVTITGTTYYVDNVGGSDSNNGTSQATAWASVSKVEGELTSLNPGDGVLFKGGDVWNAEFTVNGAAGSSTKQIVFSSYGSGQPVFDEQGTNDYCIDAITSTAKYLTFNNFECRNATMRGVTFQTNGGTMPGIIVQNFYIHNTGPGAFSGTTVGPDSDSYCLTVGDTSGTDCAGNNYSGAAIVAGACDDCSYNNQLDFEDFAQDADGVQFFDNTVKSCGGHNCMQVHYDTGAVQIVGNMVGPGGPHGFIDVKGVGSTSTPALIYRNTVDEGVSEGLTGATNTPAYYVEDTYDSGAAVTYQENIAYDSGLCFQFCAGGCAAGYTCSLSGKYYNNTCYAPSVTNGYGFYGSSTCNGTAYATQPSLDVRNNIIDGGNYTMSISTGMSITENYNDIGGAQGNNGYKVNGSGTLASHDLNASNPDYWSVSNDNFRLTHGSPCISAGTSGLTTGNSDIGAY